MNYYASRYGWALLQAYYLKTLDKTVSEFEMHTNALTAQEMLWLSLAAQHYGENIKHLLCSHSYYQPTPLPSFTL